MHGQTWALISIPSQSIKAHNLEQLKKTETETTEKKNHASGQ